MLIIPPPKFRKNRGPGKQKALAALVVVGVENVNFSAEFGQFHALFNVTAEAGLIDPAFADPGKWTARFDGVRYLGSFLELPDYNRIIVNLSPQGDEAGADEFGYANDPSDISDVLGRQLAAFSGFPL